MHKARALGWLWASFALITLALSLSLARPDPDPFVLLDEAKLVLGHGKLDKAQQMLGAIPLEQAEDYVAQEVVYERLLIVSAFLTATQTLHGALTQQKLDGGGYADWLKGEQARHAAAFAALARDYLARTAGGAALDFVRFRLPVVSDEYLQDVLLYTDPMVLSAAVTNWEDGRQGLGKGLIGSQARVALVLAAAVHYDLPQASSTVEQVAQRLRTGVPIAQPQVLDWIADTALRYRLPGDPLAEVAAEADARLAQLLAAQPDSKLKARMVQRELGAGPEKNAAGAEASKLP
jgi:hypothetical protein